MAVCTKCNRRFKSQIALDRHTEAKHDEPDEIPKPVPCLYCSRRFGNREQSEQHMAAKHGWYFTPPEDERQAKALRRFDHERRAQLKAERRSSIGMVAQAEVTKDA